MKGCCWRPFVKSRLYCTFYSPLFDELVTGLHGICILIESKIDEPPQVKRRRTFAGKNVDWIEENFAAFISIFKHAMEL